MIAFRSDMFNKKELSVTPIVFRLNHSLLDYHLPFVDLHRSLLFLHLPLRPFGVQRVWDLRFHDLPCTL